MAMSVHLLTFLALLFTGCLLAQEPFTSSDSILNTTAEQPESQTEMKGLPSQNSTSSPLENLSSFTRQPSNVSAAFPAKNTVTEEATELVFRTTEGPILETGEVAHTVTASEQTYETTPPPSHETVSSSIQLKSGITSPEIIILPSPQGSDLTPTQAGLTETSGSATQNKSMETEAEESVPLASTSSPAQVLTETSPPSTPESAQATASAPWSDEKPVPPLGSTVTSDISSSKTQGFGIIIIIILAVLVLVSAAIFLSLFFHKRRKRRTENFSSSFRNGGSVKSKRKKGTEDDAWFGPVALMREADIEALEEEGKDVDGGKVGDRPPVVLSTFKTKEEEKDGVSGGSVGGEKDKRKDEEVPLLDSDENVEKAVCSSAPRSSFLHSALPEADAGQPNGGAAFCLTSAV